MIDSRMWRARTMLGRRNGTSCRGGQAGNHDVIIEQQVLTGAHCNGMTLSDTKNPRVWMQLLARLRSLSMLAAVLQCPREGGVGGVLLIKDTQPRGGVSVLDAVALIKWCLSLIN